MSNKYMPGIPYLESSDFEGLKLKQQVGKGKPVVIMVQGVFCGYCTQAKGAFMDFAKQSKNAVAATIQIDSEKELGQMVSKWDPSYRGVPVYLGFSSNGTFASVHQGGRDTSAILAFGNGLK